MNDPRSKEQLKADFGKILMDDADWYFHKQGWYAKSLSETGSVNIVWRLMENFDQTGNIIAHVSENQVHMSRVRILEGLLESGDNNIQHAKAALQGGLHRDNYRNFKTTQTLREGFHSPLGRVFVVW